MKGYKDTVGKVMDFLGKNQYCDSIIKSNRRCFNQLEDFLSGKGMVYSPQNADDWYQSIIKSLSKSYKGYYKTALLKLQDVYETGEIQSVHQTKTYTVLEEYWKSILDEYLLQQEEHLTSATVDNHKHMCARFLIYLQRNEVKDIAGITYEVIIRFYKEDIHRGRWGKVQLDGCITIFMRYLYKKGLVPYGFTVIIHYLTFGKAGFWKEISPDTHEKIRDIIASAPTVTVSRLRDYQVISEKVHRKEGYSKTVVSTFRRAADLLLLFLDMNGYPYSPGIAELWFNDVRRLCGTEAFTIRRGICLIAAYHESSALPVCSVFREKKRTFDLLPEWSKEAAYRYVSNKTKEGWALSTLNMIRSSICRLCNYLDRIGISNFKELEASHIKQFNLNDVHKTPAGKNAYNVRIRHFLLYLGLNGYLGNPMLFVALTRASAPKESIVVVLTEDEMATLNREFDADDSVLSLRKKAMLLLGLKMGMRGSDIVKLKSDDVDWNNASIRFVQDKTGVEVNLPMPLEVGNAIFRYIMEERSKKNNPSIFLSEKAPHKPVGRAVCHIALKTALPERNVPGSGFHVTRKTYATDLLKNGVGIMHVADALGQRGISSVHRYLSLDENRMKMCALSLEECGIGRWDNGR